LVLDDFDGYMGPPMAATEANTLAFSWQIPWLTALIRHRFRALTASLPCLLFSNTAQHPALAVAVPEKETGDAPHSFTGLPRAHRARRWW